MAVISLSMTVDAPIDHTFEVYSDIPRAAERIPGILSVEVLSEGPVAEGFRWRETRRFLKKEATEEMWITEFDPSSCYVVEAQSHGMKYVCRFDFTETDAKTRIDLTYTTTPLTFGAKLAAPIFGLMLKGTMKKCFTEDLEALRDVCEQQENTDR